LEKFDIVIVGGGPAGASAAITLGKFTNLRVAIIERHLFDDYRAGESVSPAIFPLLDYLGIGRTALEEMHLQSYGHSAAWGSSELISRDLIFTGQGNGMHLDRTRFDKLLLTTTSQHEITIFQPAEIRDISRNQDWNVKIFSEGSEKSIIARYLIDCSGKNAIVVKKSRCRVYKDDNLISLYAYYHVPDDVVLPRQTLIETTEHGWYYLTPLPAGKLAIAFITDADILKSLDLNNPKEWQKAGEQTQFIKSTLAKLPSAETFRHYAIHSRIARLPDNENWTAAGDAATCFDPISSMGIGHAISSGIHSARVAEASLNGDATIAASYHRSLLNNFETYMRIRQGFYSAERRWSNSPFWQRRISTPTQSSY
jgi:2-polyprenyl-6-methoxyphenol hydroxylase-like FAD-dependent oxidoreductase